METLNISGKIPKEVAHVTFTLERAGFEAYLVGGCVRDLIMDREPKDWDVTTNATPDQVIGLFEKTVYENIFGTVAVFVARETIDNEVTYETVEVTPYRTEAKYTDFRHPEEVKWADNLEEDLKRRDFTVNALALDSKGHIVDLYDGLKDIKDKNIRAVGNPDERLQEDALRMLRAVRFSCQLGFAISYETTVSIQKNSPLVSKIASERIKDEFQKILLSDQPAAGVEMLQKFGLLKFIIPELEEGIGCDQSGEHLYDVWNHGLLAAQHAANKGWPLSIRLAALFHDVGKPRTRRLGTDARKKQYTFYGHEVVGAKMTRKIMERLKFPRKEIELVETLVRNHMFFSDTEKITLSAVRRIISKVGKDNIWRLMDVRECDRVGMKKKEAPYRLRKYFAMVEEAMRDPISVTQLKVDGNFLKNELGVMPGPRMGWMLHALLEDVLDKPENNTIEYLSGRVKELDKLDDARLKALGEQAKEKKEEIEEEEIEKLHKKHGVRSGKGTDRKAGA